MLSWTLRASRRRAATDRTLVPERTELWLDDLHVDGHEGAIRQKFTAEPPLKILWGISVVCLNSPTVLDDPKCH